MTEELNGDAHVTYTVREVLTDQTNLLHRIDTKVDGKADKSDLVPIVRVLDEHTTQLSDLHAWKRDREVSESTKVEVTEQRLTRRQKVYASLGIAFLGLTALAEPVISHFINFK